MLLSGISGLFLKFIVATEDIIEKILLKIENRDRLIIHNIYSHIHKSIKILDKYQFFFFFFSDKISWYFVTM